MGTSVSNPGWKHHAPAEPDTSLEGLTPKYYADLMMPNLVFKWELVYNVGYTMHQQNLKSFVGSPIQVLSRPNVA